MPYILLAIGLLLLLVYFIKHASSPKTKRLCYGLLILIGALVFLRVGLPHLAVIFGAFMTALPYLQKLLYALLTMLKFRSAFRTNPSARPSNLTPETAREILGVSRSASKEDITQAYHRLMKAHHPDKGGSPYFARQLTEAKDLLLRS